jgi:hypothetical protein
MVPSTFTQPADHLPWPGNQETRATEKYCRLAPLFKLAERGFRLTCGGFGLRPIEEHDIDGGSRGGVEADAVGGGHLREVHLEQVYKLVRSRTSRIANVEHVKW